MLRMLFPLFTPARYDMMEASYTGNGEIKA